MHIFDLLRVINVKRVRFARALLQLLDLLLQSCRFRFRFARALLRFVRPLQRLLILSFHLHLFSRMVMMSHKPKYVSALTRDVVSRLAWIEVSLQMNTCVVAYATKDMAPLISLFTLNTNTTFRYECDGVDWSGSPTMCSTGIPK